MSDFLRRITQAICITEGKQGEFRSHRAADIWSTCRFGDQHVVAFRPLHLWPLDKPSVQVKGPPVVGTRGRQYLILRYPLVIGDQIVIAKLAGGGGFCL
jgi:hypothetical protein